MTYIRDDIYFCSGCRAFHSSTSHELVDIPGIDYFFDPDTGIRYKVNKSRRRSKTTVTRGFSLN